MLRRLGLLLTVVAAALLAGVGMVLAQANAADVERTNPASASKPTPSSKPPSAKNNVIPDRYIVILDGSEEATAQGRQGENRKQEAQQVANDLSQESKVEEVTQTYGSAVKGFAAKIPEGKLDEVRSDPRVELVAEDREAHATAQTFVTGVDRVDAELSSTQAGNGSGSVDADIAVIDTGIYTRHADLNIAGGKDCSSDGKNTYSDDNGHGTHVAGSAAAKDNTTGVVGVAPGARLWAVKVLKANGSGSWSDIICGIDYVTQSASTIEVANISLGGGPITSADDGKCGDSNKSGDQGTADAVHRFICNSVNNGKVTYTVAAGNETDDSSKYIPAAFDEVITVSALADYDGKPGFQGDELDCSQAWAFDDQFALFSNFGSDVDIAAPGVCIKSTWKGSKKKRRGTYKTISGTSMASPHVAGAAALYKVGQPTALPSAVRTALISTANTEGPGTSTHTNPWSKSHNERVMLAKNY